MTLSLFSANWYRIAPLKPRLRDAISIRRQHWRDQLWYFLKDEVTGRQHRINTSAYQFIGRCNGKLTVQQVWDAILLNHGDNAPTQDEVIQLLVQLNQLELLQCEQTPDSDGLFRRRDERAKQKRRALVNPFAMRIPIGNPTPWLNKLSPIANALFSPAAFMIWLAIMLIAILIAASEWDKLLAHASLHMLTPRYLTMTMICFPIIKALHETAHGLAVRKWNGEVHEFGISLLVLVPAPYVDASAASAFTARSQRIAVGAAGIIVEMTLAAIALLIWQNVQPGLIQDIAFVVMFIGTVSTLLFNGNPLLRFDGYYVLSDLLDIPNLATRSSQYWNHLLTHYLLRANPELPQMAKGEHKWLLLYAPLSFIYRVIISITIVFWLGGKWFLLGLIATLYLGFTLLLKPLAKWSAQAMSSANPGQDLARTQRALGFLAISAFLILFVVPFPFSTKAPAVVWLPEQAQIRPQIDGFIKALPMPDGAQVKAGDLVAVMENADLLKARDKLIGRLEGLRADQFQMLLKQPAKAQNIAEEISSVEKELAYTETQISQLNIYAQTAGKLVMPHQADVLGSFIHRGANLGYVFESTAVRVRAAVPEEDAYLVKNNTSSAKVWMIETPDVKTPVQMTMDVPAATRMLPSSALGDRAGGPYVTDPTDKEGDLALEPVFLFDLKLDGSTMQRVGGRAWVRFDHGFMPLGAQLYKHAMQLFIKNFEPSS